MICFKLFQSLLIAVFLLPSSLWALEKSECQEYPQPVTADIKKVDLGNGLFALKYRFGSKGIALGQNIYSQKDVQKLKELDEDTEALIAKRLGIKNATDILAATLLHKGANCAGLLKTTKSGEYRSFPIRFTIGMGQFLLNFEAVVLLLEPTLSGVAAGLKEPYPHASAAVSMVRDGTGLSDSYFAIDQLKARRALIQKVTQPFNGQKEIILSSYSIPHECADSLYYWVEDIKALKLLLELLNTQPK